MMNWSERLIARELAVGLFAKKLVVVDRCNWTGYECDLLCVTTDLRIVDVEIKISRADLKADAKKDKWWRRKFIGYGPREEIKNADGRLIRVSQPQIYDEQQRHHPPKVWKHYYALPAEIWTDSLFGCLPSSACGVVLLDERKQGGVTHKVVRRATPNRDAAQITPVQAVNIARLANLRMWSAYDDVNRLKSDVQHWRDRAQQQEVA